MDQFSSLSPEQISLWHYKSLSDHEKLHYLLGKLTGKAQAACAGIKPSAENYKTLFDTLVNRYEDKRTLAATYLQQLMEFKPLSSISASNLDFFNDRFVNAVRALKNLKLTDLQDFIFLQTALTKLDPDTVRTFENSNNNLSEIPTFDKLVEFLDNQTKILQRAPTTAAAGGGAASASRSAVLSP